MKLENTKAHMRNKAVLVNGTVYQIDANGIADVPDQAAADKLLQAEAWREYRPQEGQEPTPKAKAPKGPENAPEVAEKAPEQVSEVDDVDQPVAESGEDYPDPSMDMSKKKLQRMADDYELEYKAQTTKAELVEMINAAMYPEEE